MGFGQIVADDGAFLKQTPGHADIPVIVMELQPRQSLVVEAGQVDRHWLHRSMSDLVNPPVLAVVPSASFSWHSPVSYQSVR